MNSNTYGYVFATFNGNGADKEKLSLYYSVDGKSVMSGLNPVYVTDRSLRDPSTIFYNGVWYTAYTVNNGYDKVLGLAKSTNLRDWELVGYVSVVSVPGIVQAWAPELTVDSNGILYMYFSAIDSNNIGTIWYTRSYSADNTQWTTPTAMKWTTAPEFAIDASFVYDEVDSMWYCFYSKWGSIERASSTSLTGTYTIDRTGDWAGWGTQVEGPEVVKDGSTYRIYMDRFGTGNGIAYSESQDLETWTPLKGVQDTALPDGSLLRHGSIIPLTEPLMFNEVVAAFLPPNHLKHAEFAGSITMNSGQVHTAGTPTLGVNNSTDGRFVSALGWGKFQFVEDGIYALTAAYRVTSGSGVTRTFAQFLDPNSGHLWLRNSGGAEDCWSACIPNFKISEGQIVQIQNFQQSSGQAQVEVVVRITKIS